MSGILFIIAVTISCICVVVFLISLKISIYKCKKCKNSCSRIINAESSVSNLDTIIETCVTSINQKMVSTLKENNSFIQSDKEEAFNECKKMIYTMVSDKTIEALKCLGMDAEEWINTRIEYFVRKHKTP
jgi:hypothetical protein